MKRHIERIRRHLSEHSKRVLESRHVRRSAFLLLCLVAGFTIGLALLSSFRWQHGFLVGEVSAISATQIQITGKEGELWHVVIPDNWDKKNYRLSSPRDEVVLGGKIVVLGKFLPDGCLQPLVLRVVD